MRGLVQQKHVGEWMKGWLDQIRDQKIFDSETSIFSGGAYKEGLHATQAKLGESSQAWSKKNLTNLVNKHFVPIGQWGQVVQPIISEAKDVNLEVT